MKTINTSFPASRVSIFLKKIDQVQKRARKLKVSPLEVEVSEPYAGKWSVVREGSHGGKVTVDVDCQMVNAEIIWHDALKLPSEHKLLAVLERVEEHTFITSLIDGEDFAKYRNHDFTKCDHCGHKRYRTKSMLIEHEGQHKVIGSSCIVDFLGYDPSNALHCVSFYTDLTSLCEDDDLYSGLSSGFFSTNVESLVKANIMALEHSNWNYIKSSSTYDGIMSTPDLARYLMEKGYNFNEDYNDLVESVMAHFTTLTQKLENNKYLNDFEYKVAVLAKINVIESKHFRIISGAISSYVRTIRSNPVKTTAPSEHFGTVNERVEVEVEVTKVHTYVDYKFSYYGTERTIINGLVNGKDKFTWFTSPSAATKSGLVVTGQDGLDVPVVGTVKIKGTVKSHDDGKYGICTILNRVSQVK
jgi:hypothetical protein